MDAQRPGRPPNPHKNPPHAPRRAALFRGAVCALLLIAALSPAFRSPAAAQETPPPPATPSLGLRLRYRSADPAERTAAALPAFIIVNQTGRAIPLEYLEIVYWFTDDPGVSHAFACDFAPPGCEKVTARFDLLVDDLYALRIGFQPDSGEIPPGEQSGEIRLRFTRQDQSEFSQADDYSFLPAADSTESEQAALYYAGNLVWGGLPDALLNVSSTHVALATPAASPPATSDAPTPSPAPPTPRPPPPPPPATGFALPSVPSTTLAVLAFAAVLTAFLLVAYWTARRNR